MAKQDKVETAEAVQTAPKFSVEKLRENCMTLFGVTTSTFDGATHGVSGEFTVDEMKNTIEKWQNTKIKKEAN